MNILPENKPRKEPKTEVSQRSFQMFKNGMLNTNCPNDYNWLVGFSLPLMPKQTARPVYTNLFSCSKINGQYITQ